MVAFVNVKKLRDLFVKHTRVQRRKYEATSLAAKKGILELLRRQAALHNSRSALRDTAAEGLMDGADAIQRQYSQTRQQLDREEVTLLSEQERLLDPISRSGGPLAAAVGHIQGATDQEAPSYNTNSSTTTQHNSPVRTESSPARERRAGQTSVLGMSDPMLLNSLPLFAQHPASLCVHDREQGSAALLLFGMMKQVADDPTHRPFYSDIDLVNVLPSRLRPHTTSPDRPGDMVMVNAGQCIFYLATQFGSVRIVNAVGECTCKVGYVKVLPDMVKLVGNCIAVVKSVHRRTGDEIVVQTLGKSITQVMKPKSKKKKSLEDGKKSGKTAGKTLELCDCVNDYAMMTFLDGGVPSFVSRAFDAPNTDSDGDDDDNNNDDGNESDDIQDTDEDQDDYDSDDSGDYDSEGNLKKIKAKPTKRSNKASSSTKSRKDDAKDKKKKKKRKRMN
jgi:hypothetical protein